MYIVGFLKTILLYTRIQYSINITYMRWEIKVRASGFAVTLAALWWSAKSPPHLQGLPLLTWGEKRHLSYSIKAPDEIK